MHEMSLIAGVLAAADQALAPYQVQRVNELTVSAGPLANLLPEALDYAFLALSEHTRYAGARLTVQYHPLDACCNDCGREYQSQALPPICPHCGSHQARLLNGGEVLLAAVDFD